jgi:NAD-dependent deacetylase
VHGNIDHMRCSGEHDGEVVPIPDGVPAIERDSPFPEEARALLRCATCARAARPHVLWFDEYYDEQLYRFHTALDAARGCAVLVTAGSTGATNLPNQMVGAAARGGALLLDVNPDANAFARAAEAAGGMWLRGPASREIARIADALVNPPR